MTKSTVARKAVSAKLIAYATKAFEELSGSKTSDKISKQISRGARKLTKIIHAQVKKIEKKNAKLAKAAAKKKAKQAKTRTKNSKPVKSIKRVKTSRTVKKVPAN